MPIAAAENGDGQTFHTADGRAELTIYGTQQHPRRAAPSLRPAQCEPSRRHIQKIGSDFYAVSGTRGAAIYYLQLSEPDVLSCFYVSYPAAEKAKWDAIVPHIGQSLRFALRGSQ
jgi:hypothetical protein